MSAPRRAESGTFSYLICNRWAGAAFPWRNTSGARRLRQRGSASGDGAQQVALGEGEHEQRRRAEHDVAGHHDVPAHARALLA